MLKIQPATTVGTMARRRKPKLKKRTRIKLWQII